MTARSDTAWDERPLSQVIAHIIDAYHEPTRARLADLLSLARRVESNHARDGFEDLSSLADLLLTFADDLRVHMKKEEAILFPLIASGAGPSALHAVQALILEHDDATAVLDRLRSLTDSYRPPPDAPTSLTALYNGLRELDSSLTRHMDIENEILFPRALHGDS